MKKTKQKLVKNHDISDYKPNIKMIKYKKILQEDASLQKLFYKYKCQYPRLVVTDS